MIFITTCKEIHKPPHGVPLQFHDPSNIPGSAKSETQHKQKKEYILNIAKMNGYKGKNSGASRETKNEKVTNALKRATTRKRRGQKLIPHLKTVCKRMI